VGHEEEAARLEAFAQADTELARAIQALRAQGKETAS